MPGFVPHNYVHRKHRCTGLREELYQCEFVKSNNMFQDFELAVDYKSKDAALAIATSFSGDGSSNVLHKEAMCGQLRK
jgi:hypothetical protein